MMQLKIYIWKCSLKREINNWIHKLDFAFRRQEDPLKKISYLPAAFKVFRRVRLSSQSESFSSQSWPWLLTRLRNIVSLSTGRVLVTWEGSQVHLLLFCQWARVRRDMRLNDRHSVAVSQCRGRIIRRVHSKGDCVTATRPIAGLSHFEGSFKCGRQMQPSFPGFER
jgi:hypothetical protein